MDNENIKTPLMLNNGVLVGDLLYFTAVNSQALYALNLRDRSIELKAVLPNLINYMHNYERLIYYNDNIWLFPRSAPEILIYNIKSGSITKYPIPFIEEKGTEAKIRNVIQSGELLWVLPYSSNCLIKINMDTYSVKRVAGWKPEKPVGLMAFTHINFREIELYKNKIYFYRWNYPIDMVYDIEKQELSKWDSGLPSRYAMHINDEEIMNTSIKELSEYENEYGALAFAGIRRHGDWIYVLPNLAAPIVAYNTKTGIFDSFIPEIENYHSIRTDTDTFATNSIAEYGKKALLLPNDGDCIIVMEGSRATEYIRLSINEGNIIGSTQKYCESGDEALELSEYLDKLDKEQLGAWIYEDENADNNNIIGRRIYDALQGTLSYIQK